MTPRGFRAGLLALLATLGAVYASGLGSLGMLTWDEAEYACLARSLVRGEGFTIAGEPNTLRPPLLPVSAAAAFVVAGPGDRTAKAAVVAWALVALAVVAWVFARAYDPATGLVAAALLGTLPAFLEFVPRVLTEVPFIATFTAALALAYAGAYREPRLFAWSWTLVGVSLLARYTGVLFAPVFVLGCLAAWTTGGTEVRQRARSAWFWLSPLAALAVQAPWLARQWLVTGDALFGFRRASGQLQAFLPGAHMPWYAYPAFLPGMLSWPVLLLAGVGAAWAIRRRDRVGLHCLGVVAFVLVWFSFYRMKEVRMATSTLPLLAALAAVGVTRVLVPLATPRIRAALAGIGLAAVLVLDLAGGRALWTTRIALGYPSFVEAMASLKQATPPGTPVLGEPYAQITWYADRPAHRFPSDVTLLPAALADNEWVAVVNFERGQPDYARGLPRIASEAPGAASMQVYRDDQFATVLIPARLLRPPTP